MMKVEDFDTLEYGDAKKGYSFKKAVRTWINAHPLILNLSIYDTA